MAKQTILKERGTGEVLYPQTLARLVQTANSGNVDEAISDAKIALFDDEWTAAGGTVIVSGVTYGLNGLTDISYNEALKIYALYPLSKGLIISDCLFAQISDVRTFFPINGGDLGNVVSLACRHYRNTKVEKIVYKPSVVTSSIFRAFYNCANLTEIKGEILMVPNSGAQEAFDGCAKLKEVRISTYSTFNSVNISFPHSPLLSLSSLNWLVGHRSGINAITITVHPSVYVKLTDESNAEWNQILIDAAAKNISFATV